MNISKQDKNLIAEAVKQAEGLTAGEIVPVILKQSDFYPAAHFRLCLIFGILAGLITYQSYDFDDPLVLLWAQIPGFILGYFLAYIPVLKRMMTPKNKMAEEVRQRAIEVFYEQNVSNTKDRTGIMIYVSLLERKVEILADCGINEKVEPDHWHNLMSKLVIDIKSETLRVGLVKAIMACGQTLSHHFPLQDDDTDELANELITD
jgi:putative membrane protein